MSHVPGFVHPPRCPGLRCGHAEPAPGSWWCEDCTERVGAAALRLVETAQQEGGHKSRRPKTLMDVAMSGETSWLLDDCHIAYRDRSWNTLYDWLSDYAESYVLGHGGSREDAEELTSDILLEAWSKPRPAKPRSYLMQAVRNRWVDCLRARQQRDGKWLADYSGGGGITFVDFDPLPQGDDDEQDR